MAYIGRDPQYGAFEKQALTADGSTTTFTLDYTVGSASSILVSVAGVHQEPETAWANGAFDRAIADVRSIRNRLLAETDYLALSDNTLTSDMTTYRQNLRDITDGVDTVDKCNAISWPTKP